MRFIYILLILCASCTNLKVADDYPRTTEEIRRDKRSSSFGKNGIVLYSPEKAAQKYNLRNAKSTSNKILFAALEILSEIPIEIFDHQGNILITGWGKLDRNDENQHKFNILVTGNKFEASSFKLIEFVKSADGKIKTIAHDEKSDLVNRIINLAKS